MSNCFNPKKADMSEEQWICSQFVASILTQGYCKNFEYFMIKESHCKFVSP